MKTLCFVFSWKGQYQNAIKLEQQLSPLVDKLYVINSDDDNTPEHWVNIGNECYFSDQFRKALEIAKTEDYDVFWHVQADASYTDWKSVVDSAVKTREEHNWGVYAPNVDDTFYVAARADVVRLENNLSVVGTTDNTCWFIDKQMIDGMCDNLHLMKDNHLGWGWDLIVCGLSHIKDRKVIRDYNFTINHPKSTGYKKEEAEAEMMEMYRKCPNDLREVIYKIKTQPSLLTKVQREVNRNTFFYSTV
jgi:hypothetical protein